MRARRFSSAGVGDGEVSDAAPDRVEVRLHHPQVEVAARCLEELAHAGVGEAEHGLEDAPGVHLVNGHDLVPDVRGVDMGLEEPSHGVAGRQAIVGDDGKRPTADEVDPTEVPHERDMCGDRAHREAQRSIPVVVAGGGRAQFAVDTRWTEPRLIRVERELDQRNRCAQPRMALEAVEIAEIPLERAGGIACEIAGVGARHGNAGEVDTSVVFGRT